MFASIVITGSGEKSFVAGADINEFVEQSPASGRDHALAGQHVFDLIENLGKPVIAAVNGYALGGGCELAMACTLRIAADTARFGQPEINLGLVPGYGGTQRLPRLVGKGKAMELILTGSPISAEEAERIGLVNRVVPAAELLTEARRWRGAGGAGADRDGATSFTRSIMASRCRSRRRCAYEATLFGLAFATDDMREETRAFLEKRKPVFRESSPWRRR